MAGINPEWHTSGLRVKDPQRSLDYYQKNFGMRLVAKKDFEQFKFSLYFLASLPDGTELPALGTQEAVEMYWHSHGTFLALTHNWGTENDPEQKYHPGNAEGDGFGHIAFTTPDVYKACEELEAAGVSFKKKPDEGNMKGLAFAYDPDGYWVEIIRRPIDIGTDGFILAQTMLRIKDPKPSLEFYQKHFGMTLFHELHFPQWKFSLFFLGTLQEGEVAPTPGTDEAAKFVNSRRQPVLELTHNHGTEEQADFKYNNGSEAGRQGFTNLLFTVDNAEALQTQLLESGVKMLKKLDEGSMKGLAFASDPDGYRVEIIPRDFYKTSQ